MPTTIESLELEVQSSSTSAVSGIDALSASLAKLKNAVKGGVGLTSVTNQLKGLNAALSGIDSSSAGKLDTLTNSLSKLSGLGNIKISSSIGNQLKNIGSAATSLNGVDFSGISRLSTALQSLASLGKSNLTSFITQLGKLPQLAQTLRDMDMAQFTSHIQQLSNALAPLASQLNTVATAFTRLPANIRNTVSATNTIARANNVAANSYINLWAKCRMAMNVVRTGARVIASWITESNSYIENLNLFTASMGEYASEARKYADIVGEVMGIDPGQFMRNQGIFMTITEGFGVASDRAYTMSKNLTQLGYDLSSFFNISFEDSMLKLQSGISGELEPLRRLGYDLSQARLQQEALNLGIDKSISKMTQAEKAQIRYYAIMTQVTVAQGDMARTLNAPANQLRVLQAQVTQCARALGNIFIPALNAVLPYVIAFVKIIRMAANAIASLFEFELPEIDYSGISGGGSAAGDLADGLGDATKKAKKLKNALFGIDELNVLSPNDDSSDSGSGGLVGGGDLGFELPTYDFLKDAIDSRVQELIDKFKEWAGLTDDIDTWAEFFHTKLGRILTTVGAIALGLAAWKISKAVLSRLQYIQSLRKLGLGKPLMISVGLSLLVGSVALLIDSIRDALQLGLNEMNFTQMLAGALGLTGGGALLGKALIKPITVLGTTLTGSLIGGAIGAIGGGVTLFITGIWLAIKDGIDWLIASLITAGGALAGAGIGALIGSVGGPLGAAIGALVGIVVSGIIAIVQNWESVSAWFKGVWENIKNFFTSTIPGWWNGSVVPFFQAIPEWFKGILESIRQWFVTKWTAITTFMSGIPAKIGKVIDSIKERFLSLPGKIGYALGFALGKIVDWAVGVYDYLKVKIPETIEAIKKWFLELPDKIHNAILGAITRIVTWGSEMFSKFKEAVTNIITNVRTWFSALPDKIYTAISGTISKISTWCSDMIAKIKEVVPKVIDTIVEFFKGIPDKLKALGADIWQGLIDGLTGAWNTITTAMKNFIDGFVQGFKDALGIHSPSTVFKAIGDDIVAGLLQGVQGFTNMMNTVKEWAGSVIEWFAKGKDGKGIVENFKETAGNIINGFKDKIGSTYTTAKTNITTWANSVKEWFSNSSFGGINRETFTTFANNTIEGFKSKITSAYTNTKSAITTWASQAKEWFTSSSFGGVNSSSFQTFANNTIEGFKSKISSAYTNTKSSITTWASNVKNWFTDNGYGGINNTNWQTFANNVIEGFKSKIGSAYTNTKSAITTWASNVKSWFSDIASNSAFSGFATNVIDGFKSKIGSYYTTAKSAMTTFANSVKGWFEKPDGSSLVTSFLNIGKNIIQGFIDGVSSLWDKAMNIIKDFGKSIISSGKKGTEEKSPSRAFKEIGAFVIEGFNIGIKDTMGSSFRLMSEWTNGITSYAPTVGFAVDSSALKYLDSASFTKGISANVSAVSSFVVEDEFETAMDNALERYYQNHVSQMAHDVKRQADKEEQTIVQVGNRTVTDAVTTQQRANGYRFAT